MTLRIYSLLLVMCAIISLALSTSSNADIFKWVDKEGNPHFSNQPPPAEINQDKIQKLESLRGQSSVSTGLFESMIKDYHSLPNVQLREKYWGKEISDSGPIHDIEYLDSSNSTRVVIRLHTDQSDFERQHQQVTDDLNSLRSNIHTIKSVNTYRFLVEINYPGKEIGLRYKKGDNISFRGNITDFRKTKWDSTGSFVVHFVDYYIYCKPVK